MNKHKSKSRLWVALAPLWRLFGRKGYVVIETVTEEGVGRDTLDRCAVIAAAKSDDPISVCLRRHCGDVAAPPDRFAEVAGLGVSAQFSGQMIHLGNAEYLNGLQVETPEVSGQAAFVSLEGRLLGYYKLLKL
jgi:cation transport ATPase